MKTGTERNLITPNTIIWIRIWTPVSSDGENLMLNWSILIHYKIIANWTEVWISKLSKKCATNVLTKQSAKVEGELVGFSEASMNLVLIGAIRTSYALGTNGTVIYGDRKYGLGGADKNATIGAIIWYSKSHLKRISRNGCESVSGTRR